jgi:hypothetical protein
VFGDLQRHVVAGGYDAELFAERDVHPEELALARYLERVRPDLAPCFSRYWIDLILRPAPVDPSGTVFMWPWTMETRGGSGAKWTPWDQIELVPGAELAIRTPCPTKRLTAVVLPPAAEREPLEVRLEADGVASRRRLEASGDGPLLAEFELEAGVREATLSLSHPGYLLLVAYEAPADRGLEPQRSA